MATYRDDDAIRHAALWLIGPDVPGLLATGSKFVTERGGNIDKDIADRFGEKAVVFMSLTASPEDIQRMTKDTPKLKEITGCGVVFQPMNNPPVPEGYQPDLYGFDIVTDDARGLIADVAAVVTEFNLLIVGHTGERRSVPGPRHKIQSGQKYVVHLPLRFDHHEFTKAISAVAKKYNGSLTTPLKTVPGLLWNW